MPYTFIDTFELNIAIRSYRDFNGAKSDPSDASLCSAKEQYLLNLIKTFIFYFVQISRKLRYFMKDLDILSPRQYTYKRLAEANRAEKSSLSITQ